MPIGAGNKYLERLELPGEFEGLVRNSESLMKKALSLRYGYAVSFKRRIRGTRL